VLRRLSPPRGPCPLLLVLLVRFRESRFWASIRAGLINRRNFRRAEGFISSDQIEILRGTL